MMISRKMLKCFNTNKINFYFITRTHLIKTQKKNSIVIEFHNNEYNTVYKRNNNGGFTKTPDVLPIEKKVQIDYVSKKQLDDDILFLKMFNVQIAD